MVAPDLYLHDECWWGISGAAAYSGAAPHGNGVGDGKSDGMELI